MESQLLLENQLQSQRLLTNSHRLTLSQLLSLSDKLSGLLASREPLAFQAIQAMTTPSSDVGFDQFDPSEEGELQRIRDRGGIKAEDEPDGEAGLEFLRSVGVDPDFLPD